MITVDIDGKEVQVDLEKVKLGEGYALITPDKVPDGYFTKEAHENTIKERLKNIKTNTMEELRGDESFRSQLLSDYGITLDEEGKPKGLVPESDLGKIKSEVAKQVSSEYEQKLKKASETAQSLQRSVKKETLMKAFAGKAQEVYLTPFSDNDDPYVVKQFESLFGVTDDGKTALLDSDGSFKVGADGGYISPSRFIELNADNPILKSILKDTRNKSSEFGKGGQGGGVTKASLKDPAKKAEQFDKWRSQGLNPTTEYNKLKE
jgi:hypothetical protein